MIETEIDKSDGIKCSPTTYREYKSQRYYGGRGAVLKKLKNQVKFKNTYRELE